MYKYTPNDVFLINQLIGKLMSGQVVIPSAGAGGNPTIIEVFNDLQPLEDKFTKEIVAGRKQTDFEYANSFTKSLILNKLLVLIYPEFNLIYESGIIGLPKSGAWEKYAITKLYL